MLQAPEEVCVCVCVGRGSTPWCKDKSACGHWKQAIAILFAFEFKLVTCSVWHKPPFGSQSCEKPNIQLFFLPGQSTCLIITPLLTSLRLCRELNSPSSTLIKRAFSWLSKHVKFIILISRGRSNVWLLGIKQHTVINTKDNDNLFSSGQYYFSVTKRNGSGFIY